MRKTPIIAVLIASILCAAVLVVAQGRGVVQVTDLAGVWQTTKSETLPWMAPSPKGIPDAWVFELKTVGENVRGMAHPIGFKRYDYPVDLALEGNVSGDRLTLTARPTRQYRANQGQSYDGWKFTGKVAESEIEFNGLSDVGRYIAKFTVRRRGPAFAILTIDQDPLVLIMGFEGGLSMVQIRDANGPVLEDAFSERDPGSLRAALEPGKYTLRTFQLSNNGSGALGGPLNLCETPFQLRVDQTLHALSKPPRNVLSPAASEGCNLTFLESSK